jgi:hypothetical protein
MEFIGIDVAKAQLEFVSRTSGQAGTNTDEGSHQLVACCKALPLSSRSKRPAATKRL